jgi:pimeloyl-ACP methyl ester carboxylesterase
MTYRDTSIDVRGRSVRLLRGGAGAPLLYLHDTFTAHNLWLPLHEHLAAHYEVILPVHPGCAGSETTDIETMEDLVFHCLDLCEALRLDHPIVLGASLGGWVATELAVRYAHRLQRMVLLDALGLRIPDAPAVDMLRLDAAQTRAHLFAEPAAALAQQLVPDIPAPEEMAVRLQARQTLARFAWQFPDNPRLARYLYRAHVPTLILWGAEDRFVPSTHGRAYQAGIPDAKLVVLPQCGHLPHVEQPEACCRAIMDFLAQSHDNQGYTQPLSR